jgi:hypothetical protein
MDKEYTKITKMIDDYVDNLDKPIKFIYGGITEQPHKERHKQHRLEDTNYKGTKIKLITWRKNHTKELIKDVETYLIYKLRQNIQHKHIIKHNKVAVVCNIIIMIYIIFT